MYTVNDVNNLTSSFLQKQNNTTFTKTRDRANVLWDILFIYKMGKPRKGKFNENRKARKKEAAMKSEENDEKCEHDNKKETKVFAAGGDQHNLKSKQELSKKQIKQGMHSKNTNIEENAAGKAPEAKKQRTNVSNLTINNEKVKINKNATSTKVEEMDEFEKKFAQIKAKGIPQKLQEGQVNFHGNSLFSV